MVGEPVGVSVGVSELNSVVLVGENVGNEVTASITSVKLCTSGVGLGLVPACFGLYKVCTLQRGTKRTAGPAGLCTILFEIRPVPLVVAAVSGFVCCTSAGSRDVGAT